MSEKKYTILVVCFQASGHINPLSSLLAQLNKTGQVRIIYCGSNEFKELAEKSGCEFRSWPFLDFSQLELIDFKEKFFVFPLFEFYMKTVDKLLPELTKLFEEENEKIDLIIYDSMAVFTKWALQILGMKSTNKKQFILPARLTFSPSFVSNSKIYPNKVEQELFEMPTISLSFFTDGLKFLAKYVYFHYFKYGLPLTNPFQIWFGHMDDLNLCPIMPELQPRSHLYPKSIKFIGLCASEEIRGGRESQQRQQFEEPLNSFLSRFSIINPTELDENLKIQTNHQLRTTKEERLIYASFGTVFNKKIQPYIEIIEAFKQPYNGHLLISTGYEAYDQIAKQIDSGKLSIPDHILVMRRVPQLDVLKRASLFISHCGQNSTGESIHYGVPILAIPVSADQPAVAYRVADELGLGIRLSLNGLNSNQIREAGLSILNDKSYLERVCLYSKLSRKYDGPLEGSRLIVDYLQNIAKKTT